MHKHKTDIGGILLYFFLVIVIGIFIFNIITYFQIKSMPVNSQSSMGSKLSMMKFTEFDRKMAIQFMDKNNDGKCDSCGMHMEQCIDGGMMQCSMDPSSTVGVLGSQHIHADWKIYIHGKSFDWSSFADLHERQMHGDASITSTSAFMHIHPAKVPEVAGYVLHMHATGISLSLFFESLGMKFDNNCLVVSETEKYCDDETNSLKFFVNRQPNNEYKNYVFNDLDKILISYGSKDEDVDKQLNSITGFAEVH